jgi:hypothetical protein
MKKGLNRAEVYENLEYALESSKLKSRPYVFLSHKREDKAEYKKIADYLKDAEIDYYLDILDDNLQRAASIQNSTLITESIKNGIRKSTPMLVVVSKKNIRISMGAVRSRIWSLCNFR